MVSTRALLNLTRLHTAGWEGLIFVLGPLMVGASFFDPRVMRLWLLGVLVNSFIFTLNNLADLPRDRLNPRRQSSPLVDGSISTSFALWLSCALPIAMWLLIAIAGWPPVAEASFAVLLFLGAYLCVYQKTSKRFHPLFLDVLFGVAMAGPIPVGIAAIGMAIPAYAWILTALFMTLCVGLNTIGGNLKDLPSDLETGFRTTSIALGVGVGDDGTITISPQYRRFVYVVALVSLFALLVAVALLWTDLTSWKAAALSVVVAGLCLGLVRDVYRLVTGARPPTQRGREAFFAYGLGALLVVVLGYARPAHLAFALGLAFVWEYTLRLYWSRATAGHTLQPGEADEIEQRSSS